MLPAMYFDSTLSQSFIGDEPGSQADTLAAATQQVLGIEAEPGIESATSNASQVWYIVYTRSVAEYKTGGHKTHPDLEFLNANYTLQLVEDWDGLQLYFFTKSP